ncbi:hypothetical protein DEA06_13400 [Microbacterium sp. Gd 4-13]|uniref:META domain-containing protein n=1 Tax=Microbacterium sp. Gd 4-13 TaxID=2173179 RepID=UPI000D5854EE|nr:META domain-containing protein [Microbacterium sp. Gd 4-13]PVW03506.1 hypothetical protein DEA06_13400 [Microbacterium sp. Gd 4-13]
MTRRDLGASRIREHSRGDVLGVVGPLLWIVTPLLAAAGYIWLLFQGFSLVGCSGDCREQYLYWPIEVYPWAVGAVMIGAVAIALALLAAGRRAEWSALAAFVLVLSVIVSATAIREYGFAPMHERNARIASGEITPSPNGPPIPPTPEGLWGVQRAGTPHLVISTDGTLSGSDGCNAFSGTWTLNSDGVAIFRDVVVSTEVCDGVDTWLSYGRSAYVVGSDLWIGDAEVGIIGFLAPAVR